MAVNLRRMRAWLAVLLLWPVQASAQVPRTEPLMNMNAVAEALGVQCSYCHAGSDFKSYENPEKEIARQMMAMAREIESKVSAATGRKGDPVAHCASCHRGVPVPRSLNEIMTQTINESGVEAAIAKYRDLRKQFFARDTYDFRESGILGLAQRLAESRPDDAIALLEMNLEFNPRSTMSYVVMSRAHTRKGNKDAALQVLRKALELEPENGIVKGYLYQLDPNALR